MSKCNVAVTLDGWQAMGDVAPTFHVGDPITGTVHVWVNAPVRCDGLDLVLVPVRSSPGYRLGLELQPARLFEGQWEVGEYDYRFSLPSPWLPTHEGKILAWKWIARSSADIPWAIDPKGESEFRLLYAETPSELEITPQQEPSSKAGESAWLMPLSGLFFLSVLVVAAGLLARYFDIASEDVGQVAVGAGLAVGLLSLIVLGATTPRQTPSGDTTASSLTHVGLAHRRGGGDYRSGADSFVDCDIQARSDVASMSARLVVQEYIEWTTTKNKQTTTHRYEHLIHQQDVRLRQDVTTQSWRGSLRVPEPPAVPCFSIGKPPGHGVVWKVELLSTQQGKSRPEVTRRFLKVRPTSRNAIGASSCQEAAGAAPRGGNACEKGGECC